MRWSIESLGAITRAEPASGAADRFVDGVTIDSRTSCAGSLFVALRAGRDGHEFVEAAFDAGALAALVDRQSIAGGSFGGWDRGPLLVVEDTLVGLERIGADARQRMHGPVIGITGSVGKTTTKDMAAAVLSHGFVVSASERSFNNEFGVPLTLANSADDTEVAVIEMGARGIGHIESLCAMVHPTIAVVTAVASAHLEFFGDLDAVARGKGELVESLDSHGTAILNGDDPRVESMSSRCAGRVIFVGEGREVRAEAVGMGADLRATFDLATPWGDARIRLAMAGRHHVTNALLAAASSLSAGAALDAVVAGLESSSGSGGRMQIRTTASGATLIDDSYNANPESMEAGLRSLAEFPAERRVAVVGVMAELGHEAADAHQRIAALAFELGVELVAVGTDMYGIEPTDDVSRTVGQTGPTTAVLLKGSRVAGLERFVDEFLAGR